MDETKRSSKADEERGSTLWPSQITPEEVTTNAEQSHKPVTFGLREGLSCVPSSESDVSEQLGGPLQFPMDADITENHKSTQQQQQQQQISRSGKSLYSS